MNYCYDAQFEGNILTAGRTRCEKPPLFRTLKKAEFLGKIRK